jgi:TolB-like protein
MADKMRAIGAKGIEDGGDIVGETRRIVTARLAGLSVAALAERNGLGSLRKGIEERLPSAAGVPITMQQDQRRSSGRPLTRGVKTDAVIGFNRKYRSISHGVLSLRISFHRYGPFSRDAYSANMGACRSFPDEFPMAAVRPPIDLAAEPDFGLGPVGVRPSTRELVSGGAAIALEPRVMQVLVALAHRRDETVTRDELIERCWNGLVVGDDAVQRCVGRLRKLASEIGGFEIETLSRIGYRLRVIGSGQTELQSRSRLLAVLPFDDLSEDGDMAFLSDAVADEILQTIARQSTIKAVGRTSSFAFRGADKITSHIAEALGVTHVLDGSVRRSGDRVRVSAHLMDVSDQTMAWSDRFDGSIADLFALQEAVAAGAVTVLSGVFHQKPAPRRADPRTLQLIQRLRSVTGPSGSRNIDDDLAAVSEAEAFAGENAEALGLAAETYAALRWTADDVGETLLRERARTTAERALALDPNCGAAYKALSLIEPPIGRFAEVEEKLLRARKNAPADGELHWALYYHYLTVGRLAESFAAAEEAYRVDPLRPPNALAYANALYSADRNDEALALMRHTLARWPDDPIVYAVALWTSAASGEFDFVDRIQAQTIGARFTPEVEKMIARATLAVEALRQPSRAARDLAMSRLEADLQHGPPRLSLVGLCAHLGVDLDALYDRIDRIDFSSWRRPNARLSPLDGLTHLFLRVNARLRENPRFVDLCRRLGLVDYWRATNHWPDCAADAAYDFRRRAII